MLKEVEKKVFEKYPKTEKEKSCWQEKMRLERLRDLYRKRIYDEERTTTAIGHIYSETKAL